MPIVNTSHDTEQRADRVWAALLDVESFASYMDEVNEIRILEHDGARRISAWKVLLKGSELEWQEVELIIEDRRRIEFRQTEGDLAYFFGHWQITERDDGCTVELHVEFDIGIPLMAEMLNPVAARALEDNSRRILEQLGERAAVVRPAGP
ncbi:type II toxin-antitoxin system RatA family toxin [Micromonospora sp. C95]|uniref:type II toxin-antitoxin system RatA family toxin n=1 Tax=Micromonospora sp. C95 TaxID=2824882 RepID=UPI001B35C757|nr:SRPBCC family protein [Micromonospora sp. C95]MBQ1026024.1 SRPBCC family protein [Micromonospora sp. C95]